MQKPIFLTSAVIIILAGSLISSIVITPVFAANTAAIVTQGSTPKTTDAYDPYPININVGDTVVWTNKDSVPHTVTSGSGGQPDGKFDSSPGFNPVLAPQKTFSHTFEEPGEFPYYCGLHPNMVGRVIVAIVEPPLGQESSVTVTVDGIDYEISALSETTKVIEASVEPDQEYTAAFDKAGEVELTLPKAVFSQVTAVMLGEQEVAYEVVGEDESTITISFALPEDDLSVVIVPEFPIVAILLVAAMGGMIAFIRLSKNGYALQR
jgi:plastocyanin